MSENDRQGREQEASNDLDQSQLLLANLHQAFDADHADDGKAGERYSYIAALMAVAHFLKDGLGARALADRFHTLASNIDDLNRGVVTDLLTPLPISNRPGLPAEVWVRRVKVVLAVDMLIADGATLHDASDKVAKIVGLKAGKRRNAATPGKQIQSWRACLKKKQVPEEAYAAYLENVELAKELSAGGGTRSWLTDLPRHTDAEPLVFTP